MRPGTEILEKAGGLHGFMNWKRALLMDSGGFQMVSLLKLAEITEVSHSGLTTLFTSVSPLLIFAQVFSLSNLNIFIEISSQPTIFLGLTI